MSTAYLFFLVLTILVAGAAGSRFSAGDSFFGIVFLAVAVFLHMLTQAAAILALEQLGRIRIIDGK